MCVVSKNHWSKWCNEPPPTPHINWCYNSKLFRYALKDPFLISKLCWMCLGNLVFIKPHHSNSGPTIINYMIVIIFAFIIMYSICNVLLRISTPTIRSYSCIIIESSASLRKKHVLNANKKMSEGWIKKFKLQFVRKTILFLFQVIFP